MEMNSTGEGSAEPSELTGFIPFCIREYVAEVRKIDWKKCCPFKLSGNPEADKVLASLLLVDDNALDKSIPEDTEAPNFFTASQVGNTEVNEAREDNNALVNSIPEDIEAPNPSQVGNTEVNEAREDNNALVNSIPEDVEAPNLITASQVGNSEVHEARSKTPTDKIIGDDAVDSTTNGGPLAEATRRAEDARLQNETNITGDVIVAENDKPQDPVIDDNAAKTINTPSESAACKVKDAICQNEISFANDIVAAEIDNLQETAVVGHDVNAFNDESPELVSNKAKNVAQSQKENSISDEDAIASGNDNPVQDGVFNDNGANAMNNGPSESSDLELRDARCQNEKSITDDSMAPGKDKRRRNLARRKPQKFRLVSDIYKELGSCIYRSEGNVDSEFTAETSEDDSDEVTLGTFIRGKRSVRESSKRIDALKNKRKAPQVAELRLDKGKRSKSVSEDNRGNDSELGSKYYLRKNRINELDSQMTNKRNEFSTEDSLLSRGRKSNRETVQEDCAREVLKLLDGNQRRFTEEESHSRPSHGVKRAHHSVQPPITISINNPETASGRVKKRIRESSPPTDNESMAVLQLLRLSKAWVNTETSSQTATEDPTLSVAKHKSPSGLDGVVPPASGLMVSKPPVEVNMIDGAGLPHVEQTKLMVSKPPVEVNMIDGAGLPHVQQTKSGTYICAMSRNPAEFSIPTAKKFMRRGKVVKAV